MLEVSPKGARAIICDRCGRIAEGLPSDDAVAIRRDLRRRGWLRKPPPGGSGHLLDVCAQCVKRQPSTVPSQVSEQPEGGARA